MAILGNFEIRYIRELFRYSGEIERTVQRTQFTILLS